MVDLDALKAELEAAGLTVVRDEDDGTITATRNYGAGHIADIHVRPDGRVSMSGYAQNGRAFADMPVDRRMFDALAIIARHVVPVVTPEAVSEHIAKVLSERVDTRITPDAARELSTIVVGSTPEPDAEARDVLAEALKVYYGIPADERAPEADGIADAGLAALRDKGFAVVRTADVEPRTCLGCKHFRGDESAGWFCFQLDSGKVHPTFACAAWEAIR